ncbi:MAG: transcription antitermination factor NusB [Planctomycetota bacterium]
MARPRDIRRLAFQALFELDARPEDDPDVLRAVFVEGADEDDRRGRRDREAAWALALEAFGGRRRADDAALRLAPEWPAVRQPAVDRAILRLSIFEMTSGRTPPKVVVNEAVELAKEFSTERSPSFVNGVLDKYMKGLEREARVSQVIEPAKAGRVEPEG